VAIGSERPRRLDAIHDRHPHVHDHDVGLLFATYAHRVLAVAGAADNRDVGLSLEQRAEAGADDVLVVGDHDADGHAGGSPIGSTASTAKPPP
jgi:hypothetical protein